MQVCLDLSIYYTIHLFISCPTDAVGSVGFHPLKPLLLSVSGSRHFDKYSDHMSEEDSDADQEPGNESSVRSHTMAPYATDNAVKLWSF